MIENYVHKQRKKKDDQEELKIYLNPQHPITGGNQPSKIKTLLLQLESNGFHHYICAHHAPPKPSAILLLSFVIKLVHVVQRIVGR